MGKIVTLGEVVADVYQEQTPSAVERQLTARRGGDGAQVVRSFPLIERDRGDQALL